MQIRAHIGEITQISEKVCKKALNICDDRKRQKKNNYLMLVNTLQCKGRELLQPDKNKYAVMLRIYRHQTNPAVDAE